MRITVIQGDGLVGVDGVFREVDLSHLDENIHAIQFDTQAGKGHVEFDMDAQGKKPANQDLTSFADYQWVVQAWEDAAPSPEPEPEPPGPPSQCTRRQGRLALLQTPHGEATKLDAVEAALEAIADPMQKRAAMIEYEADTWERSNAFLQAMWAQLGSTEEQLDALFTLAVTL